MGQPLTREDLDDIENNMTRDSLLKAFVCCMLLYIGVRIIY